MASPPRTPAGSPAHLSAAELRDLIRNKELSALDVTEAVLDHLEAVNPRLNAVVAVRAEGALADARAADALPPAERGPLHGIPFTAKDANESADLPTAYGSLPFAGYRPGFDSEAVARLRRAGGILVGTTAMPEFGLRITTDNRVSPPTRNPWNTEHGPAGSSGGAAAAVAAGIGPLALAADGAGSVRVPASACGIVGLKPTRGRTPWAPAAQEQWAGYVVNGPMARTVGDAALMLDTMAGPVVGEPYGLPRHPGPFLADDRPRRRLRVAYTRTPPHGTVVPEVREVFERAVSAFGELDVELTEDTPDLGGLLDPLLTVIAANVATMVRGVPPEHLAELEPTTLDAALRGERLGAADYCAAVAAAQTRAAEVIRFWTRYDILLTPTLTVLPPPLGTSVEGPGFEERWREYADWLAFTYPFNITGQPAVSLPAGRTANDLPVGVQLVGAPGAEALLLGLAADFERARPWAHERPRTG
ncbi:amidase [Kitasatospora albolonga]